MTATTISTLAGAGLSLLFSYAPGFQGWFARLDGTHKRLVMLGLLLLGSALAFGIACTGYPETSLACTRPGLVELLEGLVFAIMANQSTYQISSRRPKGSQL